MKKEYILVNKNNKHEQYILYFFLMCGLIMGSEFLYFYGFLFIGVLFMNGEYVEEVSSNQNSEGQEVILVKNTYKLRNKRFQLLYFKAGRYFVIALGAAVFIHDLTVYIRSF